MLNTLDDYIWRSLPDGSFGTNPNLSKKVAPDGTILPYYGNTMVFLLPDNVKCELKRLRDGLYAAAPGMLAAPLREETFHMTLHDLANSPNRAEAEALMPEAEARAREISAGFGNFAPIAMRGTWTFNMVNTSVVLGLAPVSAEGRERLAGMYRALEAAAPLGYALTPHITLAYFRPGEYGPGEVARLRDALGPAGVEVELRAENLVLQRFTDMNSYHSL